MPCAFYLYEDESCIILKIFGKNNPLIAQETLKFSEGLSQAVIYGVFIGENGSLKIEKINHDDFEEDFLNKYNYKKYNISNNIEDINEDYFRQNTIINKMIEMELLEIMPEKALTVFNALKDEKYTEIAATICCEIYAKILFSNKEAMINEIWKYRHDEEIYGKIYEKHKDNQALCLYKWVFKKMCNGIYQDIFVKIMEGIPRRIYEKIPQNVFILYFSIYDHLYEASERKIPLSVRETIYNHVFEDIHNKIFSEIKEEIKYESTNGKKYCNFFGNRDPVKKNTLENKRKSGLSVRL